MGEEEEKEEEEEEEAEVAEEEMDEQDDQVPCTAMYTGLGRLPVNPLAAW